MEAATSFDWGTVAVFDCVIDWPQGRGSHLAGFLAQFIHRPWMEGERNEGRASKAVEGALLGSANRHRGARGGR